MKKIHPFDVEQAVRLFIGRTKINVLFPKPLKYLACSSCKVFLKYWISRKVFLNKIFECFHQNHALIILLIDFHTLPGFAKTKGVLISFTFPHHAMKNLEWADFWWFLDYEFAMTRFFDTIWLTCLVNSYLDEKGTSSNQRIMQCMPQQNQNASTKLCITSILAVSKCQSVRKLLETKSVLVPDLF